jgi:DNA excision repair protein ERCC-2
VSRSSPSYLRFFPYEEPYDHQREAMAAIHDALGGGDDVLFEGATGTGKTLAALAPALDHARETGKTVVITTNVHQQTRQFQREASAIAAAEELRAVVFRGKGSMCHIDVGYEECQALRETTRELAETEEERDAVEEELATFEDRATCDYYYRNLTAETDEFFAWLYDDVRTPDEIYDYAEQAGMCGYELLKDGIEGVDLVVCNYHHLLDPTIREQFFQWLGRDPEDVIAVFDEAHNVESAARDHARRTLTETTLEGALDELASVGSSADGSPETVTGAVGSDDPRVEAAANVLETFCEALRKSYRTSVKGGKVGTEGSGSSSTENERIGQEWQDLTIEGDDRRDDLTLAFLRAYTGPGYETDLADAVDLGRDLDRAYERAYKNGETSVRAECRTLQAATFVEAWLAESDDTGTYPVVSVRRRADGEADSAVATDGEADSTVAADNEIYGRAELYTCIPEAVTRSLFEDLYASVLMSATLRPFDVTEDVLGLSEPETLAYGPQFPGSRRRTYAVDGPALFASRRDDPDVQRTVTGTIEDAARMTPGNTLVFFPSYSEAARYHERVSVGTRYLDEPGTPARELRERFVDDDDGVLFTSLWGTLGEGVSYDGDDARTVIVVGVPYPYLDDRMSAVQDAYDTVFGDGGTGPGGSDGRDDPGWRYAVEIPTVRKTRQAVGRVVRSPEDFGVRVLLDARYTERAEVEMSEYAVRGTFPPEQRAEIVDVQPEKLKFAVLNFYADVGGYDGEPPSP